MRIKSTWAAPERLVRRIVAALHQEEGSPNYGMIFKQLDAARRRHPAPQPQCNHPVDY